MKLKDVLIGIFAVALLGTLALLWLAPAGLARAPDITLTTLEKQPLPLNEYRGRPLLINFWATTCPGCIKEMPQLVELYRELAPQGLEIIGVAMSYDPPAQVRALVARKQIPYPVALDEDGAAARAFGNVRLTPSNFLIAPDGHIVYQKIGEPDRKKLRTMILELLDRQGKTT
ncbi:MAG TPA: TlpA family protein disulfide reductase [Gammaproteobacteria bacterium]|nr:TlpA family protein disulfide reductase [Gammaproteobacteria bacterium]